MRNILQIWKPSWDIIKALNNNVAFPSVFKPSLSNSQEGLHEKFQLIHGLMSNAKIMFM